MLLHIDHETRLTYSEPVTESVIEVRMGPPSTEDQTVLGYRLRVTPEAPPTTYRDGFGNRVELFNLLPPHGEVVIKATSCVRLHRRPGAERMAAVVWPLETPLPVEAAEFLGTSQLVRPSKEVQEFCARLPIPGKTVAEVGESLMNSVRGRLTYEKKVTTANTPVGEALALGRGVCQDFAHLFLAAARHLGLPARYVSGYVNQPGEIATHAWVQIWGGHTAGWADLDPTRGIWAGNDHVVTAVGRDFADVPPNRGVWRGLGTEEIAVLVTVKPVDRVPPELADLTSPPVWTISGPVSGRGRMSQHQLSRRGFRQQQSQQ